MSRTLTIRGDGHKAQMDFWRSTAPVKIFSGGLGSGKTFCGAIEALKQPAGSTGIVIAPTYAMMRDASQRTFFEWCPPAFIKRHNKSENKTELMDGKEIFWRSADKPERLRGINGQWGWVDEGAYLDYEAFRVLRGRLRRGSPRIWVTTTPNGLNWVYKRAVEKPLPGTELFKSHTAANTYNAASYVTNLEEEFEGDPLYAAQELAGDFVDLSGSKRIPPGHLSAVAVKGVLLQDAMCPNLPGLRLYRLPESSRSYVIGADPAEGVSGGDDSAAVILDQMTGEEVCVFGGEIEPLEDFPEALAQIARYFNDAWVLPERNNHGWGVISGLNKRGVKVLKGKDKKPGHNQTQQSKAAMFDTAALSIKEGAQEKRLDPTSRTSRINDERTREQLAAIDRKTLAHPDKKKGKTKLDDFAIAHALAKEAQTLAPRSFRRDTAPSTGPRSPFTRPRGVF